MSLQGSLETFALPDVLTLLASTAKSGALRVKGRGAEGRMWLSGGDLVASESGRASGHADVLFELLRLDEGTFVFTEGEPDTVGAPAAVAPVLKEAAQRLDAWREIEAVVPSGAVAVGLAADAPAPEIILTAERWRAVVAVAASRTVAEVADRLAMGEYDACRTVKEMVDEGLVLVAISEPPAVEEEPEPEVVGEAIGEVDPEGEPAFEDESEPVDDDDDDPLAALTEAAARIEALPVTAGEESEAPGSGHIDPEEDSEGLDEPINRGLLLKFLSSVRS